VTSDDPQVEALLTRAYELAASPLEGINEAALELADLTGEEIDVLSAARRRVAKRLITSPDHATKQVASLLRRALELGNWRWSMVETGEVP
jgi:hypothetical protein